MKKLWNVLEKKLTIGKKFVSKKYKVIWTKIAECDLEDIIDYIAIDSQQNALLIFDKIRVKCETLQYHPFRCRILPELREINILIIS